MFKQNVRNGSAYGMINIKQWCRYAIVLLFSLFIINSIFALEYYAPRNAWSVYSDDLDLDGDKDIVIGHNYNSQTEWSGVSIWENNGGGKFTLVDSIFLYGWQPDVQIKNLDSDEHPEIIAKYENSQEENEYIAIINNYNLDEITYFSLNTYEGIGHLTSGDIDDDNDIDIVVASNEPFFWGYPCQIIVKVNFQNLFIMILNMDHLSILLVEI